MDELAPLIYDELRRIARSFMRHQKPGHTLQPTALVNEAFVKLFHGRLLELADRAHFLALMARVMRQILVDHARARAAAKRGGAEPGVCPGIGLDERDGDDYRQVQLLDLHAALEALDRSNRSVAEVVEMFYFGGMTAEEVAVTVGRSAHVVRHELRFGRAWLRRELTCRHRPSGHMPKTLPFPVL